MHRPRASTLFFILVYTLNATKTTLCGILVLDTASSIKLASTASYNTIWSLVGLVWNLILFKCSWLSRILLQRSKMLDEHRAHSRNSVRDWHANHTVLSKVFQNRRTINLTKNQCHLFFKVFCRYRQDAKEMASIIPRALNVQVSANFKKGWTCFVPSIIIIKLVMEINEVSPKCYVKPCAK